MLIIQDYCWFCKIFWKIGLPKVSLPTLMTLRPLVLDFSVEIILSIHTNTAFNIRCQNPKLSCFFISYIIANSLRFPRLKGLKPYLLRINFRHCLIGDSKLQRRIQILNFNIVITITIITQLYIGIPVILYIGMKDC